MKNLAFVTNMILIFAAASAQAAGPDLPLSIHDLTYLGKDDGPGRNVQLIFSYKVPNNAVGKCAENNGLGSYITTLDSKTKKLKTAQFTCTIPLFKSSDLVQVIDKGEYDLSASIDYDGYGLPLTSRNFPFEGMAGSLHDPYYFMDELAHFHYGSALSLLQELGKHKKYQTSEKVLSAPWVYEDLAEFSKGIVGTRIALHCFKWLVEQPDLETECSEKKLREIARELAYDPSKGEFLSTVGELWVIGSNDHF